MLQTVLQILSQFKFRCLQPHLFALCLSGVITDYVCEISETHKRKLYTYEALMHAANKLGNQYKSSPGFW
jgi:hypothetical protein